MKTYTVHMVNFGLNKGTFDTLQEAVDQARALGFECAIYVNEPGNPTLYLQTVRPY